jgi:hypothetical protein
MYVDKELLLSPVAGEDITGAGPVYSTNCIDLGAAGLDIGKGKALYVIFCMNTALHVTGDGATCVFKVVTESNADHVIDGSSIVQIATRALTETELAAGKVICLAIPAGTIGATQRYLGVSYTTAGSPTTGTVDAFLAFDPA